MRAERSQRSWAEKPTLLYYNTRLLYVASIEIMPQGIRGVLADSVGNIVLMDEKPSQVHDSAEAILKSAIATIAYLCDHRPVESEVACICVASPGCSDTANRFNLLSTYQEDWSDIDLSGRLNRILAFRRFFATTSSWIWRVNAGAGRAGDATISC